MKTSKKEIEEEDKQEAEDKKKKKFKKEFTSNKYTNKEEYETYDKDRKPESAKRQHSQGGKWAGKEGHKGTFQKESHKHQAPKIDEDIHPSWAAALERKAQQKSVQFQGQKKKLC